MYDLRLSPRDAGDITPRQFESIWGRHEKHCEREMTLFGVVAAAAANSHRGKGQRAFTAADFFAPLQPKPKTPSELFNQLAKQLKAKPHGSS